MKSGFGTKFHDVYKNDSKLYDLFSSSEIFSNELDKRLKELFKGDILLDLACGTCHKTNKLSSHFVKVYALDLSPKLLEFGRETYKNNKKITYLLSSAANIPLLDDSVDTIFISWGSFPLTKTVKEMNRVLSPGGIILRIGALGKDEFTQLFPKFDLKRIKRIQQQFEKMGFKKETHTVKIVFKDVNESKLVLSKILGIEKKSITTHIFEHKVILHYCKA